jgi:hypothetical protein
MAWLLEVHAVENAIRPQRAVDADQIAGSGKLRSAQRMRGVRGLK